MSDDPKRPGRPPMVPGDHTVPVTIRVASRDYDRACSVASRERVSLSELLRRGFTRELEASDK